MATHQMSAETIREIVINRINSGQYTVGNRIPTTRALADELGAHRNTVNKALQELARDGIVSLTPGRGGGAFVLQPVEASAGDMLTWQAKFAAVAHQALLAGMSRAQTLDTAQRAVSEVYDVRGVRVKFLECNIHDAHTLAAQLSRLIDSPLDVGVIDQEDIQRLSQHYDLIITTYHHLAEIDRALREYPTTVVGVNAVPTPEVSLALARLEARRLGLVCGRENTVQSMKYIVANYHPDDDLEVALLDDTDDVRRLAQQCEALIATYSSANEVLALTGRQPDVVVEFQIEAQSIDFVRRSIANLRQPQDAVTQ